MAGETTRHRFEVLDFSRLGSDSAEVDLGVNRDKLDGYAASGWKVISLAPYASEKKNQFLVLLTRD